MDKLPLFQALQDFWNRLAQTFPETVLGVDVARLLGAVAVLVIAFVLRRPVAALALRLLRRMFGEKAINGLAEVLRPPLRLLSPTIGLLIATNFILDGGKLDGFFQGLARSIIVFMLFWALFCSMVPLFNRLEQRTKVFTDSMKGVAVAASRLTVACLGAAAILEVWGIRVGPVIAGFGLVGAAVALGAQDLFKNLIGGIFIIAERSFGVGDWIDVDGVCQGTVEEIGLRTTRVRQFDMSPIYVPNSQLSDAPLVNYQRLTYRQISWMVGLTYDTTNQQLKKIRDDLEAYLKSNDDYVQTDPNAPIFIRIDSFGDSAINMMVYCYTKTVDWGAWLKIKEALAFKVVDIVAEAGGGLAFPSTSLYVESLPKGFEAFVPPAGLKTTVAGTKQGSQV
jgi:MscS family membrane protein